METVITVTVRGKHPVAGQSVLAEHPIAGQSKASHLPEASKKKIGEGLASQYPLQEGQASSDLISSRLALPFKGPTIS